jgi:hypothetical protein
MLVDDVVTRLGGEVESLAGRVQGAAELTAMVKAGALPNVTPHAFVLPLGLRPLNTGDAAANAFTQDVDELVGIVLIVRGAGDATGARSLPTIDTLIAHILAALAGWAPDDAIGVLRLQRGQLVSVNAGVVIYQLDFAIQLQLRNLL